MTKEEFDSKVNSMTILEMQWLIFSFWTAWVAISPALKIAIKTLKVVVFWKKAYWLGIEIAIIGLDEIAAFKTSRNN